MWSGTFAVVRGSYLFGLFAKPEIRQHQRLAMTGRRPAAAQKTTGRHFWRPVVFPNGPNG
jgi:hypothetical protein